MRKFIYLFLITVIAVAMVISSCSNNPTEVSNLSTETGLIDQNGNVVTNTLTETNVINVTNNVTVTNTVLVPNLPAKATDYYNIYVPYAGGRNGYFQVSYKDTEKLKQLWLDQIQRKGANDGKVFAIRNRANNRDVYSFQRAYDGREDYYYFADNGDIYYKGGDKNNKTGETLMKRFVGATIVDYRKVTRRWSQTYIREADIYEHTKEFTVGAIYKMAITEQAAASKFADAGGGATDGAYEFIAARKQVFTYRDLSVEEFYLFKREYHNTNFIEVLVLNPHANEGNANCLGVDSYYAYYDNGGLYPMQNENLFLGERPEHVIPLLTHTTTFTDASRWWSFLAMPGQKY